MPIRTLGACCAVLLIAGGGSALAGDLVLKRVMLSTGGVAYLEHEAEIAGDAELSLDVPLDEVDDVLKSIVVYDSQGGVGSASLPGREPLVQVFGDLPFGRDALESPAALLNALQGAEIRFGTSHSLTDKLLKVVLETTRIGETTTIDRHRVSVVTESGLQQFILEDADSVSFVDPDLRTKVERAVAAIASHRAKDRRRILLTTHGTGTRIVRVGYVVGAPLWKATFRMTLPADLGAGKAQLQGWAVLENMTGQDWTAVELTLLSGNPVSFRQAIYEAYYVTRPEVPVEVAGRVLPKPDSGVVVSGAAAGLGEIQQPKAAFGSGAAVVAAPSMASAVGARPASQLDPAVPARSRAVDLADAQEGITQVAFRLPTPVTVASGRSALVPIVDRDVPIERLALFQPGAGTSHPLATLKVRNDGANGLPPGVLTLYEATGSGVAYVGDARLASLPAGEDRLLSYAVDEKTKLTVEREPSSALVKATIAQGVISLTRMDRQTVRFQIMAPAGEARHLVLEQPRLPGWRLAEPPERSVDQVANAYRLAVDLKPGEAKTVAFVTEYPRLETVRIADLDDVRIATVAAGRELDPAIRNALAELARLRRVAAEKRAVEKQLNDEMGVLTADQSRIRDNLGSVDKESALHKRYMEKLAQQETRVETVQAAIVNAVDEARNATTAIDAYIARLSI